MKPRSSSELFVLPLSTSEGEFHATYTHRGLCALNFPSSRVPAQKLSRAPLPRHIRDWHLMTARAVNEVLAGRNADHLPPLDLSTGTDFQQKVWLAMRQIDCGRTQSYGAIAAMIGKPKAVRAVGQACGANPIPVLIPCHRVLAAHQRLGGFSAGLKWKRLLLEREGFTGQQHFESMAQIA